MTGAPSALGDELKKRKPFRNAGEECLLAVLRTADVVGHALARTIEEHGITGQQYNVLRILRGAYPEGLPTLEIGDRMIQRQPNVTRLLDRLERKELVVRERCDEDRRVVRCWVSEEGLELLEQVDGPIAEADDRVSGCLSPGEHGQLVDLLSRLRASARLEVAAATASASAGGDAP